MIKPYYETELGKLYHGDCLEIMEQLGEVDLVLTDPPYEAEAHTAMRRTNKSIKEKTNDVLDFCAITEDLRDAIASESVRLSNGWALFFCQVEATQAWRASIESAGGKYKRSQVWVKPDSSPQFNGQGPAQGYECISTSWCGNGASVWNGGGARGVYNYSCNQGRFGGHPTEKPVPLMSKLIVLFSNPENLILDPFLGSGTTAVACERLGRKWIGIEISKEYCDIAVKRIEQERSQLKLDL